MTIFFGSITFKVKQMQIQLHLPKKKKKHTHTHMHYNFTQTAVISFINTTFFNTALNFQSPGSVSTGNHFLPILFFVLQNISNKAK